MKIIIMRGIPGSGKSTVVANMHSAQRKEEQLVKTTRLPFSIVSADDYHMIDGRYCFKAENLNAAHKACFARYEAVLQELKDVPGIIVVDNTNINAYEISPYWLLGSLYTPDITILRCECDPFTAVKRQKHKVPDKMVFDTYHKLHNSQLPSWWVEQVIITED